MSSVLLLTLALFAPQSLDAAPKPKGEPKAEEPLTHAERKLDREPTPTTTTTTTTTISLQEGGLL